MTIPGTILGLAFSIFMAPKQFYQPVLSMLAGGGLLAIVAYAGLLIYKQESMGGGDIKLGAMIGSFTNVESILFALFAAFFLAALFAVAGMITGKIERRSLVPFGPFIALGTLVSLGYKNQIVHLYLTWIGWQ